MPTSFRPIIITVVALLIGSTGWSQTAWYQHYKLYDTRAQKIITIAELTESVKDADVLFFGEEHNDSIAHRLQDTIYRSLLTRYGSVALSMEMFERDCQQVLDEYLSDFITDSRLVAEARAWTNYKDYRPMVNAAKESRQPVIAANAPRRYVNLVGRRGLASLDSLSKNAREYFASLPLDTVNQAYLEKFIAVMGGRMPNRNTYYAQTMWDATMAETVYDYWKKNRDKKVFHLNGRFHTDYRLGTFTQLSRKHKKLRIRNISCFAAADFDNPDWNQYALLGDYVIVTDPGVPKSYK